MTEQAEAPDWDGIRALTSRIESGKPLALSPHVLSVLRQAARDTAIDAKDAETALRTVKGATALLRKIEQRISQGSRRLMPALSRMYRLRDAGDLEGAREQMRAVLTTLVVPHHQRIAQGQLDQLADWKPRPSKGKPGKGTQPKATNPRKATTTNKPSKAGRTRARKGAR
jgi:DUSAM domain-containing protein